MRITLTIADALVEALKKQTQETGRSFNAVVNDALQAGLAQSMAEPRQRPYRIETTSMGEPQAGIELDKALQLAGILEEEELSGKLGMRK